MIPGRGKPAHAGAVKTERTNINLGGDMLLLVMPG
jgi:hypothetical protein